MRKQNNREITFDTQLKTTLLFPGQQIIFFFCNLSNLQIALTHTNLLKQWRDRAISGQTEARRVLAEMLTPSGGARSNCYKFISWVTGCSHSTIGRVNEQMKETGKCRTCLVIAASFIKS